MTKYFLMASVFICASASAGVKYNGPDAPVEPRVNECADSRIQPQLDKVAAILKHPLQCPASDGQKKFESMSDVYVTLSKSSDNCGEDSYKEIQKALRALQNRLNDFEEKCGL